jgi:hypothetical protein
VTHENVTKMISKFEKLMNKVPERYEDVGDCFKILGIDD